MTELQRKMLDWITAFIAERGFSPSYQEIADACGMIGKSHAHRTVQLLMTEGHLVQDKGRQRSLRLAEPVKRMSSAVLRGELNRRGELYSPVIMACIKRAGLEAFL